MKNITCPCGEQFHVGTAPASAKIRCRECGRTLDVDALSHGSRPAERQAAADKSKRIIWPSGQTLMTRLLRWWEDVSQRKRFGKKLNHGHILIARGGSWYATLRTPIGLLVAAYTVVVVGIDAYIFY